ncbi:metal-dependent transcriptional regulator [Aegicerativicinus sediminis]|uniref:metal-dependent transcriptional regulator n=1 Tax=Aegicerativicinus sediminis TaxID=2893202 RepID=UPI001E5210B2|nr:metal-dependent transcriptional regulator [Aegicerativicinus sediminis]
MSVAVENFIKAIYKNEVLEHRDTKPGNIAKQLGISNAAATDMAKKLANKNLLIYEKYQPLRLTNKGNEMALNVVRKHRLWEAFLFNTFDMSLHEIHREAELLEHGTSDFLADKLSDYLGNPDFDPHGDPIPSNDGQIASKENVVPLNNAEEGLSYHISRLLSEDKEFFEFCEDHGLKISNKLKVTKQLQATKMTEIEIENKSLLLNYDFTNLIYVSRDEKRS